MTLDRRSALGAMAGALGTLALPRAARASSTRREPPPDAVGMLFDTTRCVGCRACVGACRSVAGLPPDDRTEGLSLWDAPTDLNDRTRTLVKLADTGDHGTFVKVQCMHCVDPACASACMLGALRKGPQGAVIWDADYCVGCRYCQVACPFNVPAFEWDSATPSIVKCDLCTDRRAEGEAPACCEACPRDAVVFGTRAALLAEAHLRISENPDKYVSTVYGEADMGGTQVLYLSDVPFEELGFPGGRTRPTQDVQRTIQHGIYRGFVAPAALYGVLGMVLLRNRRISAVEQDQHDEEVASGAAS